MRMIFRIWPLALLIFTAAASRAQLPQSGSAFIQQKLDKGLYQEADEHLRRLLDHFLANQKSDSIVEYIMLLGEVAEKTSGTPKAITAVNDMLEMLKKIPAPAPTMEQGYMNAAEFFGRIGKNKMAYDAIKASQKYTLVNGNATKRLALQERNLGEYARRMANPDLSQLHLRKAVALVQSAKDIDSEQLYLTYNAIASMMWYESKTDSAKYYYLKAMDEVRKIDTTPLNRYFRLALLSNNISGIYNLEGNSSEAIKAIELTISSLRKFLQSKGYESRRQTAVSLQFEAIDNLAGIYKELGNYSRAEQLLTYSYRQKKSELSPSDPALFISQILLGQLFYARRDEKKALDYLTSGRQALLKENGDYLFWNGDACYTLALIYEARKDKLAAFRYYNMADSLYTLAFQGSFDEIYLQFSRNYTLFKAANGHCNEAVSKANHILDYLVRTGNKNSQLYFYQLLNIAGVYFECKQFDKALSYSQKALDHIRSYARKGNSLIDSIKTESAVPDALFLSAKSRYQLLPQKDYKSIAAIVKDLTEAAGIIERRKSILSDPKDISAMLASYQQIGKWLKQLNYELLQLSGNKKYIDTIISVHENNVYTRIRSQLDQQKAIHFAGLPYVVLQQEEKLKSDLRTMLQRQGRHGENVVSYMQTVDQWNSFQQNLKEKYPGYYNMRYGNTSITSREVSALLAPDVTVVRYIFSDTGLFAFIASRDQQNLVALSAENLADHITQLTLPDITEQQTIRLAHQLYRQLWMPFEKYIRSSRVVIIPDGILYNLSFDMLTPLATTSFAGLSQNCLLNKYAISYHYSLLSLHATREKPKMKGNFVAFAPGFFEKDKRAYLATAGTDSLRLDNNYLNLLPLPFTGRLIRKVKDQFGGRVFSENKSTPEVFRKESGNHHIIHIATHAESNNENPEYSRLIFAKDKQDINAENSLYLFDIYNCNLTSDLSVLTACESGKPGYQDGEGMISMAHAFSYAGSRAIMTGLWKLDEQASSLITEYFYLYLKKGVTKDVALQKAKLDYLQQANGRMKAPSYWAGLVLMGDTEPVHLSASNGWLYYVLWAVLVGAVIYWLYRRKSKINSMGGRAQE